MHWHWTNKFDTGEIRSSRKQPWSFNQMIRSLGTISIWLFGLVFLFAGVNINEPYLISLRGLGAAALFISSIVVLIFLIKRGCWNGRGIAGRLLILLWCLPSLSMLYADTLFEVRKRMSCKLTSCARVPWGSISLWVIHRSMRLCRSPKEA